MRIITVIGARPQFIKAAPLAAAFRTEGISEEIIHTGQHYDPAMSDVFFEQLNIPAPRWNLNCGGGTHGAMTGTMLAGIEQILLEARPDMVLVFGDTNSTLAGALAAAKLHIPVAHVEAGLRSFNRRMPEELNRICTDHLSDLLFCSSETGREQLAREGITRGVHVAGDIMADVFLTTLASVRAGTAGNGGAAYDARTRQALMTLHRPANTDDPARLRGIFAALCSSDVEITFPVHPRTVRVMQEHALRPPSNVRCTEAAAYRDLVALLDRSDFVLTDSGGLQKEAYWAGKPCITLREETEWTELVDAGWNVLTGADSPAIVRAMQHPPRGEAHPVLYGDGNAASRIVRIIAGYRPS
jgi:UDP-GlcNAc3NAcA epimerase